MAEKFDVRTLIIDTVVPGADSVVGMVMTKEGIIYGGLTNVSGNGHLILKYDPHTDTAVDCGLTLVDKATPKYLIPGLSSNVKLGHHALEIGCDGKIYGSTSALGGTPLYRREDVVGGHMISYDPKTGKVKDFGVPVPHEFGFAATVDPKGEKFCCLTTPMKYFYVFDILDGTFSVKGAIRASQRGFAAHDLVSDKMGNVYGSNGRGQLFKYDPDKDKIVETGIEIPQSEGLPERGILDAAVLAEDGTIYGGTRDGYFFSFDPEKEKVRNLGSPPGGKRLCGVEEGRDGKVYGFQGDMHMHGKGNTHLFVYDPDIDKVTDLGLVEDSTRGTWAGTLKRAYVIHATAIGLDGTIYAGETDRYPHLYMIKLRE